MEVLRFSRFEKCISFSKYFKVLRYKKRTKICTPIEMKLFHHVDLPKVLHMFQTSQCNSIRFQIWLIYLTMFH